MGLGGCRLLVRDRWKAAEEGVVWCGMGDGGWGMYIGVLRRAKDLYMAYNTSRSLSRSFERQLKTAQFSHPLTISLQT